MAKPKKKNKARELRRKGESIREIADKINASKSSVSIWCRDIKLTPKQIKRLDERMKKGRYRGRLKGARVQREKRLKEINQLKKKGRESIGGLTERDLMLFGLGLYWGDGAKGGRVKVSNSDPVLIKFVIKWLTISWGVSQEELTLHIHINQIHKNRVSEVETFWSELTGIPKEQFTKTTLIKAKNKKVYNNFEEHYGTAMVIVRKSSNMFHKMMGAIFKIADEAEKKF